MKRFREYAIAFKGLKDGIHQFSYSIDGRFFNLFENPLYQDGKVQVEVELNKGNQMLIFNFHMQGSVATLCDNCLEPLDVPVDCNGKVFVKFGDAYDEPAEDVVVLPHEEHEFNVARIIYDLMVTSLPIRHIHPADAKGNTTCNPEMMKKLSEYLVDQAPVSNEHNEPEGDPRWSELKKLIDKNK